MIPNGQTLLQMAIRYIDQKLERLEGERAECERQLEWLTAQKQELLDEAASEQKRHRTR